MSQRLGAQTGLRTATTLRVDPQLILSSQILQLSQAELEQAVESELNENQALVRIDAEEPGPSRDEVLRQVAPDELKPGGQCNELWRSTPQDSGMETDWLDLAASVDSLHDHLRAQLLPALPPELRSLGEYLIGSVNDRGYLTTTPEEAALDCGCLLEEAQAVAKLLRECEPAGIGATDLRECLMLQLRRAASPEERLAKAMLKNDWAQLVQRDVRGLARRYKVDAEAVQAAFEVILGLNPFPGEGHTDTHLRERSIQVVPDIVLSRDEQGWTVDVPGPSPISLRVDRQYEKRWRELQAMANAPKDEKRHVGEYLDRANRFMSALAKRSRMMAQIGKHLIESQPGFVTTGDPKFIRPLTRAQVARALGTHESTVSRATNKKFVQIATGEVVAFEVFFKPALRVQRMIEEILETEGPEARLSDEAIARILASKGVTVARRTVNKYRDRKGLLSSRRRKSA
jgi:RNA polymerase sigma-54 factor